MDPPTDSTDEIDVEAPKPAVPSPTTRESPSSSSEHEVSAEPPRWRFVADAKKPSGYSHLDAGRYVPGKGSDELGEKYKAPDVSLYKSRGDKLDVGKLQLQPPPTGSSVKEDVEFGKLKFLQAEVDIESSSRPESEVGELETKLQDGVDMLELQTYQDKPENENLEPNEDASTGAVSTPDQTGGDGVDEKDMNLEISINDSEALDNEEIDNSTLSEPVKETNYLKRNRVLYLLLLLLLLLVVILGVLLGKKSDSVEAYADSNNASTTPDVRGPVIVVKSTKMPSSSPSIVPSLTLVPSAYPSITLTNVPSTVPSIAPSTECRVGTKVFSIEHPNDSKTTSVSSDSLQHTKWVLKSACTGEIIDQCRPCSLGSLSFGSLLRTNSLSNTPIEIRKPFHRKAQQNLQNITECLTMNDQYVFEMQPIEFSSLCCGFDPKDFIISYNNDVLAIETGEDNNGSKIYFGESGMTCESESPSSPPSKSSSSEPSLMPSQEASIVPSHTPTLRPTNFSITGAPTLNPSSKPITLSPTASPTPFPSIGHISPTFSPTHFIDPTHHPSLAPSAEPTTAMPTASPLAFLGACPKPYEPSSTYRLGATVEFYGMVYQCVSVSCRSYGLEPGRNWEVAGYCSNPTSSPTTNPSKSPRKEPTMRPSKVPTDSPSLSPRKKLSNSPTKHPSALPTVIPSKAPASPTISPSEVSSPLPTAIPSNESTVEPTGPPSKPPATSPSREPSSSPTKRPSTSPSRQPSSSPSRRPTLKPSKPPTFKPSPSPSRRPTTNPSKTPTDQPTTPSSRKPTPQPTRSPTDRPTTSPSRKPTSQPTLSPTDSPTSKPTCSTEQETFSVCIAIDMSGSMCNGPTGLLCVDCESSCRDSSAPWDSCCSNFVNAKEFSAAIVNSLGRLPGEKAFSVIGFSGDAQLASGLTSTAQTVSVINSLAYAGGQGNHAGAIELCQSTLSSSPILERAILLITDGHQGVPSYLLEGTAELAATNAKNAGTLIIPILIPPDAPDTNDLSISFINDISSDGQYFNVPSYDRPSIISSVISQVQERLAEHSWCS